MDQPNPAPVQEHEVTSQAPEVANGNGYHSNKNGNNSSNTDDDNDGDDHPEEAEEFMLLDGVEWGPRPGEDGYDTDQELVPKPNKMRSREACHCRPQPGACSDLSCILFACNEECSGRNCPAGQYCGNQRIQNRQFKTVEVFDAGLKGRGLRVLEDVQGGDIICEYLGRAVKESKLPRLFQLYKYDRRLYIMGLGYGVYLDARQRGGLARYVNHSCQPNCRVDRWTVKGILRAVVVSLHDISAGTELTFDYQWERKRGRAPTKCHCGSANCRGTLEVKKSLEESNLEVQLQGHWERYAVSSQSALDHTIVNRTVQIRDQATDEYFLGEITGYNPQTGQHSVLYRHDMSEAWENLAREDWMILNAKMDENFMIAKKRQKTTRSPQDSKRLLGETQPTGGALPAPVKHYLYIQTPVKCALYGKHLIELCQRNFSVQVSCQQFARPPLPPLPDDPEDCEKYAALDSSQDGTVWKLSLTGVDLAPAYAFLDQQVAVLEKKIETEAQAAQREATVLANATATSSGAQSGTGKSNGASASGGSTSPTNGNVSEIVYPRVIADAVKRKLQSLRERCKGVTIVVAPSYSKSKQFARLVLEGSEESLRASQDVLWNALASLCKDENVPMVHKIPINLGFLGGVLTSEQFHMLVNQHGSKEPDSSVAQSSPSKSRQLSLDAGEELRLRSSFFASFENTQRCTVWVQAEEDKGRINGENKVIEESIKGPRKLFLGCEPKDVSRLWGYILTRAADLQRGVKFLHLGLDRVYQVILMKSNMFEFVQHVTGATVMVDTITGDHLCMDGRSGLNGLPMDLTKSEEDRASLAEELVRLQIEIYRDHFTRDHSWIFGRDWSFVASTVASASQPTQSIAPGSLQSHTSSSSLSAMKSISTFGQLDSKTAAQGAFEIAEVVANLGMPGKVGAHAAIILYRFVLVKTVADIKVREALLACVFLANKCQKESKWKRLDTVLEAGYEAFYPGTKFDLASEEVNVLLDRVLAAEREILESLHYDVFWHDSDWIISAATGQGRMPSKFVQDVFAFIFSGPVLGCGSELWLKYGVEYIFSASALLLKAKVEYLVSALRLIALKVSQAAELLVESVRVGRPSGEKAKYPSILTSENGRLELEKRVPGIKETCNAIMMKVSTSGSAIANSLSVTASTVDQRYKLISDRSRRRCAIGGVPRALMKDQLLPVLDKVAAASSCSIFIRVNPVLAAAEDLILDGTWRAIAVAEHLLQRSIATDFVLPPSVDASSEVRHQTSVQAKVDPGRILGCSIQTAPGWEGTIQSMVSYDESLKGRRIGGKSCVAGRVSESTLRDAGLRWWIPPVHGNTLSGSINDLFLIRSSEPSNILSALKEVARVTLGADTSFPNLTGDHQGRASSDFFSDRFTAISLQQWPSEKVCLKEAEKASRSKGKAACMGFSAAALQEMQLLSRLHSLISTPFGHPNFILPVGIAISLDNASVSDREAETRTAGNTDEKKSDSDLLASVDDSMFSLFRTSAENEKAADLEKTVKDRPHLVFQPTPFVLHSFVSKNNKKRLSKELRSFPALLTSWFHDLLSALVHCHSNHIVMRTIQADQIVVDHSGTAKFGCLYRCTILSDEDRKESSAHAAYKAAKEVAHKSKKKKKGTDDDEDVSKDTFQAPELLLGSPKHTKESDIWSMGCLFASLLLGKPLFLGKNLNRQSLLTFQYKIVGSPDKDNFKQGGKFPHFVKPEKRYKRGVEKALEHMLKDEATPHQKKAIDLIARMLHLDPSLRCSAEEALGHDFMVEYMEQSNGDPDFRRQYVQEWVSLKDQMLKIAQAEREERQAEDRFRKRQAMLKAAARAIEVDDDDDDDLYDMNDMIDTSP